MFVITSLSTLTSESPLLESPQLRLFSLSLLFSRLKNPRSEKGWRYFCGKPCKRRRRRNITPNNMKIIKHGCDGMESRYIHNHLFLNFHDRKNSKMKWKFRNNTHDCGIAPLPSSTTNGANSNCKLLSKFEKINLFALAKIKQSFLGSTTVTGERVR